VFTFRIENERHRKKSIVNNKDGLAQPEKQKFFVLTGCHKESE